MSLPQWRLFFEQLDCVRQARIKYSDRLFCYATALEWTLWHSNWLQMAGEVRQALMARLVPRQEHV